MSTNPSTGEVIAQPTSQPRKRGCLFIAGSILKWLAIVLVTLIVLGVVYQTATTELDKRNFSPRGQFYTVNGHQIHMVCMGEGSPTVILQAGLSASSLWWYRVQTQLSQHTHVCAYDRPGLGWSEVASGSRDALTIVSELHELLGQAGIPAPYIMAGHSYGAIWTRVYAAQYPEEVAGIVLVDSGILVPGQFASQSEFDGWKSSNDALQAVVWVGYRTGLKRLTAASEFQRAGYPAEIVPELVALQSPNQDFDTTYIEQIPAYWALAKASAAAKNLGDLPMAVLWASSTETMMQTIPALRAPHDEFASYSSNHVIRIVDGADHGSILGDEQYATQVTQAILDVIESVQSGKSLSE